MKKNLLLAVLSFISIQCCFSQSAGFNQTYIIINNTYYDLNAATANPDFNGANLGSFCQGATTGLTFKGAEHNNYKCGGCDITSTRVFYNIHLTSNAVGAFVSNNIPFTSDFANGCGGRDQKWSKTDYSTNLLSGLAVGNYTIEVYSEESTSCSGTVYASNGGANYKATFTITAPTVAPITGDTAVCVNSSTTLASATSGGVWSNSGTNATIFQSGNLFVNGAGSFTVYYTVTDGNGCSNVASKIIVPGTLPTVAAITGDTNVCVNGNTTLACATPNGVWSNSGTNATIFQSGNLFVNGAGSFTVYYTVTGVNGCSNASSKIIVPGTLPTVAAITGNTTVCVNGSTTLACTTPNGVWSNSGTNATIFQSGNLFVNGAGSFTVYYTVTGVNGCSNASSQIIVPGTLPTVAAITGDTNVCVNGNTTLACATPNGVWSNSGTNATIFQSGNLFVNGAGSFTVYYTVTGVNGCSNASSKIIVPGTLLTVAAITGNTTVCVNGSTTLACTTPNGVWSNSGTNATIFQSGNLFVNGAGSFTVYYTVTGANGCSNASSQIIVPGTLPTVAAITGNTNVCVNGNTTLACATPSGVWSNSGTNATVNNAGNVQVNGAGSFTVYYTVTGGNGCSNNSLVIIVPSQATSSTTNKSICPGGSYSFNGTTYTNAGTYIAHLNNSAGCDSAATLVLTMLSSIPAISGSGSVCVGATSNLSNSISGGVWSSTLTDMASINSSGVLTGKNAGTTVVKYVLSTGSCTGTVAKTITVNAIPNVPTITYAAGTSNPQLGAPTGAFCVGKTFNVLGSPAGGSWSATGAASITAGGSVTINAVGAGSIKYIYTSAAGCTNSRTMVGSGFACAARGLSSNNNQLAISNEFSLYPNPARSFINLNVETVLGSGSITITDLYGKQIKTQTLSMGTNMIDIAKLSKGLYFVSIITSEGKNTKKLIVE